MMDRRHVFQGGALMLAGGAIEGSTLASLAAETAILPFEIGEYPLVTYPQKRSMIKSRPPFETGVRVPAGNGKAASASRDGASLRISFGDAGRAL